MKIGQRLIDHIVYSVPNLEQACDSLESSLGFKPVFGGYHKTQGTKNALLNLGQGCYLEILAIDESNESIKKARWMGIDLIHEPRITRWAIKSDNLTQDQQILQMYNANMGNISGGSRQTPNGNTLEWEMILPLATPKIELTPFMVNWLAHSVHPTKALDNECSLVSMEFSHQSPELIQDVFNMLDLNILISSSDKPKISIQLKTQSGEIVTLE